MADLQKTVDNIYITAFVRVYNGPKDKKKAEQAGEMAVQKAGYYLDKGKWRKVKGKMTPKQKIEVNDRSDENKKLTKIKIKSDIRGS